MSTEPPQDPSAQEGLGGPSVQSQSQARASLEASLELLWEGHTPSGKGPRPTLSLEQIVAMAVEIADADGVEGLSMRRLARQLDVGTMTLYRYVPEKSVLLDLMLDAVSAPSEGKRAGARRSWRDTLWSAAEEARALHLRHPWLLQVNWARPVIGPNSVDGLELVMAGLGALSLTDQERIVVLSIVDAYVLGSVRQQIFYESAAEETGLGEEEFWEAQLPFMERAMDSGRYPVMAAMAEDTFDAGWDETFEAGLRLLLDGLEADLTRR